MLLTHIALAMASHVIRGSIERTQQTIDERKVLTNWKVLLFRTLFEIKSLPCIFLTIKVGSIAKKTEISLIWSSYVTHHRNAGICWIGCDLSSDWGTACNDHKVAISRNKAGSLHRFSDSEHGPYIVCELQLPETGPVDLTTWHSVRTSKYYQKNRTFHHCSPEFGSFQLYLPSWHISGLFRRSVYWGCQHTGVLRRNDCIDFAVCRCLRLHKGNGGRSKLSHGTNRWSFPGRQEKRTQSIMPIVGFGRSQRNSISLQYCWVNQRLP